MTTSAALSSAFRIARTALVVARSRVVPHVRGGLRVAPQAEGLPRPRANGVVLLAGVAGPTEVLKVARRVLAAVGERNDVIQAPTVAALHARRLATPQVEDVRVPEPAANASTLRALVRGRRRVERSRLVGIPPTPRPHLIGLTGLVAYARHHPELYLAV